MTMPNPLTSEERARLVESFDDFILRQDWREHERKLLDAVLDELARTADDARDAERFRWLSDNAYPTFSTDPPLPCARMEIWLDDQTLFGSIGREDHPGIATLRLATDEAMRVAALASSKSDRVNPVPAEGGEDGN